MAWISAATGLALLVKAEQRGQRATWCHFEDRPTTTVAGVVAPVLRCPVEVPVGGLDQPRVGGGDAG